VASVNKLKWGAAHDHADCFVCINSTGDIPLSCLCTYAQWRHLWVALVIENKGIARTQSPTIKNYAFELPTFGVIVGVSPTVVQWKGLTLEEPPSWSRLTSTPGKYASAAWAQPIKKLKTRSYQRSKLITQRETPDCTSSIYCFPWNDSSLTRITGSRRVTIAQAW